jgi:tRNA(fMet)-specific endonuclease VapC
MIFSRTVMIRRRSHAIRYDGVHAGHKYLQLHHQAPTGDTGRQIRETRRSSLNVSVMTAAELRFGAEKAGRPKLAELVEAYLERLAILDWTNEVSVHYARIRSQLERSGKPIGNMDVLIASHAVSQGMTLVTNNLKHFSSVPGLKVEVWN